MNDQHNNKRRDFLYTVAAGMGAVGAATVTIPFVRSRMPAADTLAASTTEFDFATLEPGQMKIIEWRGQPVFAFHRTPEMLYTLYGHNKLLKDPHSKAIPEVQAEWMKSDEERITRSIHPQHLLVSAVCTHLGCIPGIKPTPGREDWGDSVPEDWPGGWHCACHGSYYDLSGRVLNGSPAPHNLFAVPYKYLDDTNVLIG